MEVHRSDLNKNKHHSVKLQNHHNKYGLSDLVFSVVERCSKEVLIEREQHYIDELDPYFNICKVAGSVIGGQNTLKKPRGRLVRLRRVKRMGRHSLKNTGGR
jgi:group I intron endonuclease